MIDPELAIRCSIHNRIHGTSLSVQEYSDYLDSNIEESKKSIINGKHTTQSIDRELRQSLLNKYK